MYSLAALAVYSSRAHERQGAHACIRPVCAFLEVPACPRGGGALQLLAPIAAAWLFLWHRAVHALVGVYGTDVVEGRGACVVRYVQVPINALGAVLCQQKLLRVVAALEHTIHPPTTQKQLEEFLEDKSVFVSIRPPFNVA